MRYGDLNTSANYNIHDCVEDLQSVLEFSLKRYMRLPKKNLENFNCILIIPDIFVKHHLRFIITMLLGKLKFKSLFMHTESVMATFAMAM
jgi:actin-related protein 8